MFSFCVPLAEYFSQTNGSQSSAIIATWTESLGDHGISDIRIFSSYFTPKIINPLRAWRGGGCLDTSPQFFRIYQERRRFLLICSHIFFAHVKIPDSGHLRSGHQVTSSALTSEKVWILVTVAPNHQSPWNFQRFISLTVSIKYLARNFDIGDLRSGQFCNLYIRYTYVNGRKLKGTSFGRKPV